ncbi:MAG: hypothetical protein RSF37_13985 [Clostridium sp.]|uniref:hypothetical protein n=1 Tax=Clostridium sp. TaxID=1506 RepID=UPI002FCAA5A1
MKKIFICIFLVTFLILSFFIGKSFLSNTSSEFSLIQDNWKIELSDKPLSESIILNNTGGITGDGQKIITFEYNSNQIESIKKDLLFLDYNEHLKMKFDELQFLINEPTELDLYTKSLKDIYSNIEYNKFFIVENNSKFLIFVLNSKSNKLTAFVNYQ